MKKLFLVAVPGIALLAMAFAAPSTGVTMSPDGMSWTIKASNTISTSDMDDLREAIAEMYGVDVSNSAGSYEMRAVSTADWNGTIVLDNSMQGAQLITDQTSRTSKQYGLSTASPQELEIRRILRTYAQ